MATQAQLDEKLRQDRLGASAMEDASTAAQRAEKSRDDRDSSSIAGSATPAQLAEKAGKHEHDSAPARGFATPLQQAEKSRLNAPPPLPPRTTFAQAPPAYSADDARRSELISQQWRSQDPRSSSTHSLVPSESGREGRRTLLLVFIHGFMGNETSFQSFPAHVHNLLTITLAETHVVHTKIYPRYKSRKAIEFARDDFSIWLEPHEDAHTDVILLGHSMGGLLAGEVVLQKPEAQTTSKPFRHRILGTVNFDTPFLGMHPGVVVSGIGSLFRPAPEPLSAKQRQSSLGETNVSSMQSQASSSSPSYATSMVESDTSSQLSLVQSITSPSAQPPPKDPFFNPPFPNDVRLPERKGWSSLLHFVNKHSDGLTSATKQYFMSHIEFGGSMADYPGLKNRYEKLRALEDVDDLAQRDRPGYQPPNRQVRFVNYYTASTGRPKAPKFPHEQNMNSDEHLKPVEAEMRDMNLNASGSHSPTPTPSISIEDYSDGATTPHKVEEGPDGSSIKAQMQNLGENSGVQDDVQEESELQYVDSVPIDENEELELFSPGDVDRPSKEPVGELETVAAVPALPPIPTEPTEPEPIDLSLYTDPDSRKIAEKEHKRAMKAYQQAVKDRESAIKDRKKLIEKREKKSRQEREKQLKAEEKERLKAEKEEKKTGTTSPEPDRGRQDSATSSIKDDKPKRDKKFCMLPPKYGGKRDKCWIRVYMEGVDEVGAHCGLFFSGPQYESLVGDVGARIGKWVEEDAIKRAI